MKEASVAEINIHWYFFSALPAVYFYAPCKYIKSQKYLKKEKKKRTTISVNESNIVTLQLIYVYSLYGMCTVVQQEID